MPAARGHVCLEFFSGCVPEIKRFPVHTQPSAFCCAVSLSHSFRFLNVSALLGENKSIEFVQREMRHKIYVYIRGATMMVFRIF